MINVPADANKQMLNSLEKNILNIIGVEHLHLSRAEYYIIPYCVQCIPIQVNFVIRFLT